MVRNIVTGKNQWAVGSEQWAVLRKRRRGFFRPLPTAHCPPVAHWLYAAGVDDRDHDHHHPGGHRAAAVSEDDLATREAVLRDDLYNMRKLLDQYAADKQKLPQSLDDLVTGGYMREMPKDPMTGQADWTRRHRRRSKLDRRRNRIDGCSQQLDGYCHGRHALYRMVKGIANFGLRISNWSPAEGFKFKLKAAVGNHHEDKFEIRNPKSEIRNFCKCLIPYPNS